MSNETGELAVSQVETPPISAEEAHAEAIQSLLQIPPASEENQQRLREQLFDVRAKVALQTWLQLPDANEVLTEQERQDIEATIKGEGWNDASLDVLLKALRDKGVKRLDNPAMESIGILREKVEARKRQQAAVGAKV